MLNLLEDGGLKELNMLILFKMKKGLHGSVTNKKISYNFITFNAKYLLICLVCVVENSK